MIFMASGVRDKSGARTPVRKVYSPPKLERLGTIRELTRGAGQQNSFDGGQPPGLNKSRV